MPKFTYLFILIFLLTPQTQAAVCSGFPFARYDCQRGTISSLLATGVVTLNHTKITGNVAVYGTLTMTHARLNTLTLYGSLRSFDTTVFGLITLSTSEALFSSSKVQMINVKSNLATAKIYLQSGTRVEGSIVFEGGKGIVYISKNSSIKGSVVGGKIIRKNITPA